MVGNLMVKDSVGPDTFWPDTGYPADFVMPDNQPDIWPEPNIEQISGYPAL